MKAAGFWTWWNQYGTVPFETVARRATQCAGIITKAGYWEQLEAFKNAGAAVAVEAYVLPHRPLDDAALLAEGIRRGAQFAVINAEEPWEHTDGVAMRALLGRLLNLAPGTQTYACIDSRAHRTTKPYAQHLIANSTAVMPMIYPLAFYPNRPDGYVGRAFADALDRADFQNKPVLPVIQGFGAIPPGTIHEQLADVLRRGLHGCSLYTAAHATTATWQTFAQQHRADQHHNPTHDALERANARHHLARILARLALDNAQDFTTAPDTIDQALYVLHLARTQQQ